MQIRDRAGATLLWRVYIDWDLRIEPIARLVTVPEHLYANTRLRWCDVVVESKQRLCLKSRAQSGARSRAKALVCKYEIVMVRLVVEGPHCLLRIEPRLGHVVGPEHVFKYGFALVWRRCGEYTTTMS